MKKTYNINIAYGSNLQDYKEGKLIAWSFNSSDHSKREAVSSAKELIKVAGDLVRVVEIIDPDENPEPHDILILEK